MTLTISLVPCDTQHDDAEGFKNKSSIAIGSILKYLRHYDLEFRFISIWFQN